MPNLGCRAFACGAGFVALRSVANVRVDTDYDRIKNSEGAFQGSNLLYSLRGNFAAI